MTENLEHEWHYRLESPVDVEIDQKEHGEWEWVPIGVAIERVWSWTNREALQLLRTEIK